MKKCKTAGSLMLFFAATIFVSCNQDQKDEKHNRNTVGEYNAEPTSAPNVPPPLDYTKPKNVVINMEVLELDGYLSEGVEYNFWTFDGEVPGRFIRIREGDHVEFNLHNHPDNKLPHNIDLHAVTGPGGGAEATLTAPGHSTQFNFKALNPGLYIYHCATAPVGMHIANGMYGLILVEPKEGLPPVDKEFYLMQSEFYTTEEFGTPGKATFNMDRAIDEDPEYVVFNGAVGSLMGDKALTVEVGETVRLYVGNIGPNLISSFHVIGEIFDKVYMEGGTEINENVGVTMIPSGGAAIVEFKCEVPGALTIVDHSVFRAFNKGALGVINVVGDENYNVFDGRHRDNIYTSEGSAIAPARDQEAEVAEAIPERSMEERMTMGKSLYEINCAACHQKDGKGMEGVFPPLANSDYLEAREDRGIGIVLNGLTGEIVVNGVTYKSVMPRLQLNDDQVASILTYVHNSWGNTGEIVNASDVAAVRGGGK